MHVHSFFVIVLALGSTARLTNKGLNHAEEAKEIEKSRQFCNSAMNKRATSTRVPSQFFPRLMKQLWSQLDAMDRTADAVDQTLVSGNPTSLLELANLGELRYRMCGMLDLRQSLASLEKELDAPNKLPRRFPVSCPGNSAFDLHYHLAKLAVDAKIGIDDDLFDLTYYEILRLQQPKIENFATRAVRKGLSPKPGQTENERSPEEIKKQVDSFIEKQHPDFGVKPRKTERYDVMAKFAAEMISGSQALITDLDLAPLEPLCGTTLKPLSAQELENIILNPGNMQKIGEYMKTTGARPEIQQLSVLADMIRPIAQNLGFTKEQAQQVETVLTQLTKDGKIPVSELAKQMGDAVQARANPQDPIRLLIQQGLPMAAGLLASVPLLVLRG